MYIHVQYITVNVHSVIMYNITKLQLYLTSCFFCLIVSSTAGTACYNQNTRGDQFGNCGASSGSYIRCTSA